MMEKTIKDHTEEVTSFLKLPVYTREGTYVGHVKNVFLDVDEKRVSSLLVTNTNPSLVEGSIDVILSNFPSKITKRKEKDTEKQKGQENSEIDMIE